MPPECAAAAAESHPARPTPTGPAPGREQGRGGSGWGGGRLVVPGRRDGATAGHALDPVEPVEPVADQPLVSLSAATVVDEGLPAQDQAPVRARAVLVDPARPARPGPRLQLRPADPGRAVGVAHPPVENRADPLRQPVGHPGPRRASTPAAAPSRLAAACGRAHLRLAVVGVRRDHSAGSTPRWRHLAGGSARRQPNPIRICFRRNATVNRQCVRSRLVRTGWAASTTSRGRAARGRDVADLEEALVEKIAAMFGERDVPRLPRGGGGQRRKLGGGGRSAGPCRRALEDSPVEGHCRGCGFFRDLRCGEPGVAVAEHFRTGHRPGAGSRRTRAVPTHGETHRPGSS
ncbi:hypothetical protein BX265_8270 [Streptomyces sp. TLI_235]|nr:hypothetical protein BX265_8270 [Streptomyces sp. TLI_235]